MAWLGSLIAQTCQEPPTLVGHSLGGSIAAHFAARHGDRVRGLVLVDSGSLGRFRPALGVMPALIRFMRRPSLKTQERFARQVFFDFDRLRAAMGERFAVLQAYQVERTSQPSVRRANRELLRRVGTRRIRTDRMAKIAVPVSLIWGRNDRIMRFAIAHRASRRNGWRLHPIGECGHIPMAEQPRAFLEALRSAMEEEGRS